MNSYDDVDSDLVERLQHEFRQPVPPEIADVHLTRLQKVTAGQARRVRNRYRASLAVAAAAVAVLAVQLSTAVFTPTADTEPAAAPTAELDRPALVARVDPDTGEAQGENSRRLIGRPSSYLEAGGDDVEASVSVLDSISTSEANDAPPKDSAEADTANGQPTDGNGETEASTSSADASSSTGSSTDASTTATTVGTSETSESDGDRPVPTTSPTTQASALTTSTSPASATRSCPQIDGPGNGNSNRPSVRSSTTVGQDVFNSENCDDDDDDLDRQNGSQGRKGIAQGWQPE